MKPIKVIDLFAGPGGLGEGFTGFDGSRFEIALSVEKDPDAHKTLLLRSFYRKLKNKEHYLEYVRASADCKGARLTEMIGANRAEWLEANEEVLGGPSALGNPLVFEKWEKGEEPTEEDFKHRTKAQKRINARINKILKAAGRTAKQKTQDVQPLIVIGGPPCQAYSKIGRARRAGIEGHRPDHDERFFLYQEYAKVIAQARPDLFVMENVPGIGTAQLLDGTAIFTRILDRLIYLTDAPDKNSEQHYRLFSLVKEPNSPKGFTRNASEEDFKIVASQFGVPQHRERVIIIGVRADITLSRSSNLVMEQASAPTAPSVEETLSTLPPIRSYISNRRHNDGKKISDSMDAWLRLREKYFESIKHTVSSSRAIERGVGDIIKWERRTLQRETILKRYKEEGGNLAAPTLGDIDSEPLTQDETMKIEAMRPEYSDLLRKIYPLMAEQIKTLESQHKDLHEGSDRAIRISCKKKNALGSKERLKYTELNKWLTSELPVVLNHNSKQHMPSDLERYIFTALWTRAASLDLHSGNREQSMSPLTKHFPIAMASQHQSWYSNKFKDRFRSHSSNQRAKTLTAHMYKDGHANIHYDPYQARSLTVREAARLQSFPDDYFFEGGIGAQFKQVGNAVPPFLAAQIAQHLQKFIASIFEIQPVSKY